MSTDAERASSRRYRERNRDKVREQNRKAKAHTRAADPKAHAAYMQRWREKNLRRSRELVNAAKKRQRAKDPDRFREEGRLRNAAWAAANPQRRREISHRHTLKMYGLTVESYEALVAAQNGGCAICATTASGRKGLGRLVIDHCHETGVVRGLLCHHCNTLLGNARDSASRLRAAAEYLERLPTRPGRDPD